ncbi:MAG: NAD(P)H-dependent oxidoreductase [Hydrogenophaga sp.]|uniref:glutathione-regulated potassium-efflux system oxidoreductase KefF n=1 Tax=Hydrogenophaga sp. TaxID=1904254 RepID=UPI001D33D353|nr:NAD(P)H-dependent oxidoreductase [Hydrogenophaga sp.]MBX3611102.1 NAD(P)H-dependent oxidoreductase [Hydrogenophaga sp.]
MQTTLIIHAHPRPRQSTATRALLDALAARPDTAVRSLYERYPDFDIDVASEQEALTHAQLVIWVAPVYWYSVPALLKHWFELVLAHGWAYGKGGDALQGKTAWWVASAGGMATMYQPGGAHMRPFADFVAPIEHTARYCGMHWLPPYVLHGGHKLAPDQLAAAVAALGAQADRHVAALPRPAPTAQAPA